ncbi:MAG: winged helix DNA-binding domain-containing protein [Saprospiraceae bacterium]
MPTIPALRLQNHKITVNDLPTPQSVVAHLGAVQAQDYPMSKWAVGARLPTATDATIEAALNAGALVRTHVLRPTWHLVSGQDVRWMLALTGKHIRAATAARAHDLGLNAAVCTKANDLIAKALEGGNHLTREEVMQALERGGIETNSSRAIHFMANAETEALVCNGVARNKEQTYALLDEKVPKGPMLSRDEALSTLAVRYFTSHAPATLADFHWWSGLPMPDARAGLESIKKHLQSFEWEGKTYWFGEDTAPDARGGSVFFLPAFDEYTVSYKDRSAVFDPRWQPEVITSNGIFRPIIVVDGKVVGLWKRAVQKNKVVLEATFFETASAPPCPALDSAVQGYAAFLGLPVDVRT